jgi:hypothetical protein
VFARSRSEIQKQSIRRYDIADQVSGGTTNRLEREVCDDMLIISCSN